MQSRTSLCRVVLGSLVFALAGALSLTSLAAQADPVIGTWTLNVAKSTFKPGPALKSGTVTFSASGKGVHVVADLVDGQGAATHTEYTGNYDGKDYPITGLPTVDVVSLKRIDANSSERTDKKAGKVVQTYHRQVAADGKTMTVTHKGTDDKGQAFTNVLLFEKKM